MNNSLEFKIVMGNEKSKIGRGIYLGMNVTI